jgi:putative PIN family toxin of toxin-antitoxin system
LNGKVVLDTNILISALIKSGKPRTLVFELLSREAQLILSRNILDEFIETAEDPEIKGYVDEEDVTLFLKFLDTNGKIINVKSRFKVVNQDPDDDIILRTAYDGKANYIVSGDNHLLSLGEFRGIKIVTTDEMLRLLREGRRH